MNHQHLSASKLNHPESSNNIRQEKLVTQKQQLDNQRKQDAGSNDTVTTRTTSTESTFTLVTNSGDCAALANSTTMDIELLHKEDEEQQQDQQRQSDSLGLKGVRKLVPVRRTPSTTSFFNNSTSTTATRSGSVHSDPLAPSIGSSGVIRVDVDTPVNSTHKEEDASEFSPDPFGNSYSMFERSIEMFPLSSEEAGSLFSADLFPDEADNNAHPFGFKSEPMAPVLVRSPIPTTKKGVREMILQQQKESGDSNIAKGGMINEDDNEDEDEYTYNTPKEQLVGYASPALAYQREKHNMLSVLASTPKTVTSLPNLPIPPNTTKTHRSAPERTASDDSFFHHIRPPSSGLLSQLKGLDLSPRSINNKNTIKIEKKHQLLSSLFDPKSSRSKLKRRLSANSYMLDIFLEQDREQQETRQVGGKRVTRRPVRRGSLDISITQRETSIRKERVENLIHGQAVSSMRAQQMKDYRQEEEDENDERPRRRSIRAGGGGGGERSSRRERSQRGGRSKSRREESKSQGRRSKSQRERSKSQGGRSTKSQRDRSKSQGERSKSQRERSKSERERSKSRSDGEERRKSRSRRSKTNSGERGERSKSRQKKGADSSSQTGARSKSRSRRGERSKSQSERETEQNGRRRSKSRSERDAEQNSLGTTKKERRSSVRNNINKNNNNNNENAMSSLQRAIARSQQEDKTASSDQHSVARSRGSRSRESKSTKQESHAAGDKSANSDGKKRASRTSEKMASRRDLEDQIEAGLREAKDLHERPGTPTSVATSSISASMLEHLRKTPNSKGNNDSSSNNFSSSSSTMKFYDSSSTRFQESYKSYNSNSFATIGESKSSNTGREGKRSSHNKTDNPTSRRKSIDNGRDRRRRRPPERTRSKSTPPSTNRGANNDKGHVGVRTPNSARRSVRRSVEIDEEAKDKFKSPLTNTLRVTSRRSKSGDRDEIKYPSSPLLPTRRDYGRPSNERDTPLSPPLPQPKSTRTGSFGLLLSPQQLVQEGKKEQNRRQQSEKSIVLRKGGGGGGIEDDEEGRYFANQSRSKVTSGPAAAGTERVYPRSPYSRRRNVSRREDYNDNDDNTNNKYGYEHHAPDLLAEERTVYVHEHHSPGASTDDPPELIPHPQPDESPVDTRRSSASRRPSNANRRQSTGRRKSITSRGKSKGQSSRERDRAADKEEHESRDQRREREGSRHRRDRERDKNQKQERERSRAENRDRVKDRERKSRSREYEKRSRERKSQQERDRIPHAEETHPRASRKNRQSSALGYQDDNSSLNGDESLTKYGDDSTTRYYGDESTTQHGDESTKGNGDESLTRYNDESTRRGGGGDERTTRNGDGNKKNLNDSIHFSYMHRSAVFQRGSGELPEDGHESMHFPEDFEYKYEEETAFRNRSTRSIVSRGRASVRANGITANGEGKLKTSHHSTATGASANSRASRQKHKAQERRMNNGKANGNVGLAS